MLGNCAALPQPLEGGLAKRPTAWSLGAKPRSKEWETRDGVTLPAYRGNMINHPEFTPEARRCDPKLLLDGYWHSAMTMNFIRGLVDGGFADMYHPELWDLDFLDLTQQNEDYKKFINTISDAIRFMDSLPGRVPCVEAAPDGRPCTPNPAARPPPGL